MSFDPGSALQHRKRRHIDVCLTEAVDYQTVTTGFERYRLPYNALTQTNLRRIDLGTEFLGSTAEGAGADRCDDRRRASCRGSSTATWPPPPSNWASA